MKVYTLESITDKLLSSVYRDFRLDTPYKAIERLTTKHPLCKDIIAENAEYVTKKLWRKIRRVRNPRHDRGASPPADHTARSSQTYRA